ncbi:F-box/LRR-repeat protein 7-like isoform X1 [Branchiostoma floridae x Branchiostoma belcheri]
MGAHNGKHHDTESTGKTNSSLSQSDLSTTMDFTPTITKTRKTVSFGEETEMIPPYPPRKLYQPRNGLKPAISHSHKVYASVHVNGDGTIPYPSDKKLGKDRRLSPFDLLSDDLVVKIFSYLPTDQLCKCACVDRRWYDLSWEPHLWTQIEMSNENLDIDRVLRILTWRLSRETPNVCLMLEKIKLSGCEKLTNRGLHVIAKRCPELTTLEVAGCYNITNEALYEVVSRCPNLQHLDITGCPCITCIALTPEATMRACPLHGKQISLQYLDMTDCYGLEDAGLRVIASNCRELTRLYLRRCVRITDLGVQYVANNCAMLKEFSVSDCRRVTDFGIRELAKLGAQLRYLSVVHCDQVTDVGIKSLTKYCGKLRYLNIRGCELVTDTGVEYLARQCNKLRSLDIGKCSLVTDRGLEVLALNCPLLKKLSLKSCERITDRGVQMIAANCTDLQMLNIQDCKISTEAYRFVKRHCKRCIIEHTNPGFC